jgi:hypothetical protein
MEWLRRRRLRKEEERFKSALWLTMTSAEMLMGRSGYPAWFGEFTSEVVAVTGLGTRVTMLLDKPLRVAELASVLGAACVASSGVNLMTMSSRGVELGERVAQFAAARNEVMVPELVLDVREELASHGVVIDASFVEALVGAALETWAGGGSGLSLLFGMRAAGKAGGGAGTT